MPSFGDNTQQLLANSFRRADDANGSNKSSLEPLALNDFSKLKQSASRNAS